MGKGNDGLLGLWLPERKQITGHITEESIRAYLDTRKALIAEDFPAEVMPGLIGYFFGDLAAERVAKHENLVQYIYRTVADQDKRSEKKGGQHGKGNHHR